MLTPRCGPWFLPLALCACVGTAAPQHQLRWDQAKDSLALVRDGEEVWRCCWSDERMKPCFHPLSVGGSVLTLDRPGDHSWHYGLWFSWKLINGVNYWENDPKSGRPAGRTSWRLVGKQTHDDGSARIELALEYAPVGGDVLLRERRVLEVSPVAEDGSFTVDWDCGFTAAQDCLFDRTPPPGAPNGRANGGYAGLSLRLANLGERQAVTSNGAVVWNKDDRFRTKAPAMEYDGVLDGREVGAAILDHPDNLNAPTPWYAIHNKAMTFFTPAVICDQPHRLPAGERLRLRYRVCLHPGRWDAERLAAAHAVYAASNR